MWAGGTKQLSAAGQFTGQCVSGTSHRKQYSTVTAPTVPRIVSFSVLLIYFLGAGVDATDAGVDAVDTTAAGVNGPWSSSVTGDSTSEFCLVYRDKNGVL